eukprot:TRINITY_DN5898_c0_g1_i3.p1 TRINITY_DN5898_c0_g1~~TRINITY_DN5898_c0_g1_i3.p1  ORF type:complete len:906 (+),score=275.51 TRINITY_DN5898_c0_g1_i3:605-3322(+)
MFRRTRRAFRSLQMRQDNEGLHEYFNQVQSEVLYDDQPKMANPTDLNRRVLSFQQDLLNRDDSSSSAGIDFAETMKNLTVGRKQNNNNTTSNSIGSPAALQARRLSFNGTSSRVSPTQPMSRESSGLSSVSDRISSKGSDGINSKFSAGVIHVGANPSKMKMKGHMKKSRRSSVSSVVDLKKEKKKNEKLKEKEIDWEKLQKQRLFFLDDRIVNLDKVPREVHPSAMHTVHTVTTKRLKKKNAVAPSSESIVDGIHKHTDVMRRVSLRQGIKPGSVSNPNGNGVDDKVMEIVTETEQDLWHRGIILPDSLFKVRWDVMISILVIYSVLAAPLRLGFSVDAEGWMLWLELCLDCIFWIDIAFYFRTAFTDKKDGVIVTIPKIIAKRYLRTWFTFDLLAAMPVDLIMFFFNEIALFKLFKMFRLFRLIRLLRLFRLVRLRRLFSQLEDHLSLSAPFVRLIELLLQVSLIAHCLGCFWWFMSDSFDGEHWYDVVEADDKPLIEATLASKYLACIYWSFTTMSTVGYGDIVPVKNSEYFACIIGVLIGATTFGYIVGSMASLVGKLHETSARMTERLSFIKEYMRERRLSPDLQNRVLKHFEFFLSRTSVFDEDKILHELNDSLRTDVVLFLNRDIITKIPFFDDQNKCFISYVVSKLMPQFCVPREFIIREGEQGTQMYFLVKGRAEAIGGYKTDQQRTFRVLEEGSYFGELSLLMPIRRTASIRALTCCNLFVLTKLELDKMMHFYPAVGMKIKDTIKEAFSKMKAQVIDLTEDRKKEVLLKAVGAFMSIKTGSKRRISRQLSSVGFRKAQGTFKPVRSNMMKSPSNRPNRRHSTEPSTAPLKGNTISFADAAKGSSPMLPRLTPLVSVKSSIGTPTGNSTNNGDLFIQSITSANDPEASNHNNAEN